MSGAYQFGCFELDARDNTLRKSGRRVHLQLQPVRVLAALIEARGALVTRDQLKVLIWPCDTFVDFDKSLNTAIMKARHALGDSAHCPRYLETVPRLGYRFVAPVSGLDPDPQPKPVALPAPPPIPKQTSWLKWTLAPVPVLLAGLAAFRFTAPKTEFLPSTPLTSLAGSEITPSLSPDGSRVAFSWNGEAQDNFDIYLKEISSTRLTRLTDDRRPDISPVWSPDGKSIAYIRLQSEDTANIMVTTLTGTNSSRSLISIPAPGPFYEHIKLLTWSPDSQRLIVSKAETSTGNEGLFVFDTASGACRRLTSPPLIYDDLSPAFSPDGAQLAFVRYCGHTSSDLFVLPLTRALQPAGPPQRITFRDQLAGTPVWLPNGRGLIFSGYSSPGVPSLWRIAWPGSHNPEPLPISSDASLSLDLSPASRRLVYTRESSNRNMWEVSLKTGLPSQTPHIWAHTSMGDFNPQFSPDGSRVAFTSTRSGHPEIWIADRDGAHPRQMTRFNGTIAAFPRWSPNGRKLVFHLRLKSKAVLQILDLDDLSVTPLPIDSQEDFSPSWSRDGRWIYFMSRRSGSFEIWKTPDTGGPVQRITENGGATPLESPDGQFLYYHKIAARGIWRRPVAGGPETLVCPLAVAAKGIAYAVGKTGLYLITPSAQGTNLELVFFDLKTSKTHLIATISKPIEIGLALSPDEHAILYSQQDHAESDLMLVENFH